MITNAEELMYADKERYYHDAFRDGLYLNQNNRAVKLLKEIAQGNFLMHFQPQVDIRSGAIVGAEALVRKTDETGKLIPPDRFIPMYEAQGLMMHVDMFVLETVLKMLANWQGENKPLISVNFSRSTLLLPDFTNNLTGMFRHYGVPCDAVILEVTERATHFTVTSLQNLIPSIRAQGFKISLDDFGTEYSNLSMLALVGLDEVKLDRSLINNICTDERSRIVVESIIAMCNRLGNMTVVAEGIETEEQRQLLESFGCAHGQGWLFYRPMPQNEFIEKMLAQ